MALTPIEHDPDEPTDIFHEDDSLSWRQKLFVEFYISECRGNGTEAAARAGYRGDRHQLGVIASENLRKPLIVAAVRRRAREIMSEPAVVEQLVAFIRSEPAPVERAAWVRAIELLLKYHGALDSRVQVEHTTRRQIEVREMIFTTIERAPEDGQALPEGE
jgi:phage terminase small subunit